MLVFGNICVQGAHIGETVSSIPFTIRPFIANTRKNTISPVATLFQYRCRRADGSTVAAAGLRCETAGTSADNVDAAHRNIGHDSCRGTLQARYRCRAAATPSRIPRAPTR